MQRFLTKLHQIAWLRALALGAAGVWFLIAPYSVYSVVKYVLMVALLAMAVPALLQAWQDRGTQPNLALWRGVGLVIAAALVGALLRGAMSLLPVLFGFLLLVYGINRIRTARGDRQYINVSPLPAILYGGLVAAAGLFLLFNPFRTVLVMLQVVGALLIVMGVSEALGAWRDRTQA
ncbi:DUF308 domain-containing protein [Lacticaseibacillus absianus]|uniref:DUF308 domain-containing protein n=1 Tax=Lacticaseibacillus absianus TaxID=2729623 RepID=UPI0015CB5653|nr:DUF308 domain-containing protein [Lacticaseibacillus absianus]